MRHCSPLAGFALVLLVMGACRSQPAAPAAAPAAALDAALHPHNAGRSLRAFGGGHIVAKTHFRIVPEGGAEGRQYPTQDVTTESEVWMDAEGDYRLSERNDQDGGRQIVLAGHELMVELRHGKPIRRAARDPEPGDLLAQALGGPWAAWELVREQVTVETGATTKAGQRAVTYRLRQAEGDKPESVARDGKDLRAWRSTLRLSQLEGEVTLGQGPDASARVLLAASLSGRFTAKRDEVPVQGQFEVTLATDQLGSAEDVTMPEQAEPLRIGQRTLPDERSLLENLPGRRDPAQVSARQ